MTLILTLSLLGYLGLVSYWGRELSTLHVAAQEEDELQELQEQIAHEKEVASRKFNLDLDELLNKYTHLHR